MKHKSAPDENAESTSTVDGPGSQLRKARERKGLEQTRVAAQLHLSQSMIQSLEWDDYERLPAAVFVQGYLRKYARLLGVDEDAVIRAYQELQPGSDQQPLPRNQPDQVARGLHNDYRLIRYVGWAVVLVLAIMVFFWWQGRMVPSVEPISSEPERGTLEPGFAPPEPVESGMRLELGPASTQDFGRSPPPDASAPVVEAPAVEERQEPSMVPVPAEETASTPEAEGASVIEAPQTSDAITLIPEPVTESAFEPEPPVAAPGLLVFEFSGPCWVEVRDAQGKARIVGEMREGVRRTLNAQLGPFQVVIGDILSARVSFNGETVDLRPHARGKVARFTLDPARL